MTFQPYKINIMNKRQLIFLLILALVSPGLLSQSRHAPNTMYQTYKELAMAGYQGWFRSPGEGQVLYSDPSRLQIDMWPEVTEYEKTYPTGLKLKDGSIARFFSSDDKSTVDLHFKWMKEYGVDGVFMQRFFNATRKGNSRKTATNILVNALEAASKYQRAIAVMYDLSGLKRSGEDCSQLINDWKYLVDSINVTNQKGTRTYLFHRGKPLVVIWGVGFPDRPYNIRNIGLKRFMDFLKYDPVYGGCSVMLGVPTFWRDLNADCLHDPYLHDLIKEADLVMPWMVQRFSPLLHNDMDRYRDIIIEDMKWCKANGVEYVPCVTPGFSWHNLSKIQFPDDVKPVESIPRQAGRFYWQQISTAINAGAEMLYIAMFDEVNEGTAIFKVSDNPPVHETALFADNDGMPSDHYLWLTGEASKILKKQKPLIFQMPKREDKKNE